MTLIIVFFFKFLIVLDFFLFFKHSFFNYKQLNLLLIK